MLQLPAWELLCNQSNLRDFVGTRGHTCSLSTYLVLGNKTFKFVKGMVDPVPATFFDDSAPAFPGRTPVRRRPRAARHVAVALDDLLGAIVTVTKEVTSLQTGGIHFFRRHYCLIDLRFCFDQMKITFARRKFSPTP